MVYCLYKNDDSKYDLYALFYEEYMLNPSLTIEMSEEEEEEEESD